MSSSPGFLSNFLVDVESLSYSEIPHFLTSTVPQHESRMLFGKLNGVPVMLMKGRFHLYEGYSIDQVRTDR